MANKGGRPRLDSDTRARQITLSGRHLDMVDVAIEVAQGMAPGLIADVAEAPGATLDERTGHALAKRRREFIGALIEKHCSLEALFPTEVKVIAPMLALGPLGALEEAAAEVIEWQKAEGARLTDTAPIPVTAAIHHCQMERLKREDPDAFAEAMDRARRELLARSAADE